MRVRPSPAALAVIATLCAPACSPASTDRAADGPLLDPATGSWVDLTHAFSSETVYWPTAGGFQLDTLAWGVTDAGYFYSAFSFATAEHGGTHLDAPLHFAEGRDAADEVPLQRLLGWAAVVDVSANATPDYQVSVDDLQAWESEHGPIPDGAILLIHTGWSERWPDRESYLGTARVGPEAVAELHFPGLAPAAARWLVAERRIAALGIDTPSIDHGQSTTFETHVVLYSANVPGFENVANTGSLPATGSFVAALPMKIRGGSGGPLRIVAWVP